MLWDQYNLDTESSNDNMRKECHRPFLFMNTCKPENLKLNPAMCTKDHHQKKFISGMQVWFNIRKLMIVIPSRRVKENKTK